MGWHAARKLRRAVEGLARVLGIELLASTRALDFRAQDPAAGAPAAPTSAVRELFRTRIPAPGTDAFLSPAISVAYEFVASGEVVAAAERGLGERLD